LNVNNGVLYVSASGNVGINNVSPTVALDVTGTARVTTSAYFATASGSVGIGTTSPTSYITGVLSIVATGDNYVNIVSPSANAAGVMFQDTTGGSIVGGIRYTHSDDVLSFWNAGSEKMRITSAGNVGIGTSSPSDKLQVGLDENAYISIANGGSTDVKSGLRFRVGGGGTVYSAMESAASSSGNGYLSFSTIGSSTLAERMRILSSGLFKLTQETNSRCGVQIKKFTVAVSSSTAVTFTPTDFGLGETGQYHLEIDGGAYGSNSSGAGVYKLVYGGYSNTAGNNATAVIANVMTNGSWGWSISGSTHTITITNSSATMPKDGIIRFTVTYTGA